MEGHRHVASVLSVRRTAGRGAAGTTRRRTPKLARVFGSLSRVKLSMHVAQPAARDVSIDFRGADVGVAE